MAGLLTARRFAPLLATQMLGALNDNLFKNAFVVLVLFRGSGRGWLVPLTGAVFILPYALFSARAGRLADRRPKHGLIRLLKLCEIAVVAAAGVGLVTGSEPFLLLVLFGLGVQAAFFGPLKYGILGELLTGEELGAGNGLIEASTFIGILLGTILGGQLILLNHGGGWTAMTALSVAVLGWLAARRIPPVAAAAPDLTGRFNPWSETWLLLGAARRNRPLWRCILALSWFWALGAAFLAEFPTIVQSGLGASGQTANLFLVDFSIGIGVGALLAGRLLRPGLSLRPVLPAALVLSVFALDFAWASHGMTPASGLRSVAALLHRVPGWRLLGDLFMVAVAGGVFSVPLYALLQRWSDPAWRARMIAANNVMNAVAIVGGAVLLEAGNLAGLTPAMLLAVFALVNVAVALGTVRDPGGRAAGRQAVGRPG